MKQLMILGLSVLIWSGQAIAACQTATIIDTTPTVDFTDHGDGTVTHTQTGLMWKRCSEGQVWDGTTCTGSATTFTWQGSLQQAETLNNETGYATFTDWRVPNIKELKSIVEMQCIQPSINSTIFPVTINTGWYWSSSPYAGLGSYAWGVYFYVGNDGTLKKSLDHYVRLVRVGQ